MTEITDLTFEKEVIEASKKTAVIVDFYAPWCGPCLKLKPIIEKLSREYTGEIKIISLNIEENLEKASEYSILSIPSVKMFKN